jgi:hypothetical protein
MIVQQVFNRKVVRFQCEAEEVYKNKNFLQNLDRLFDHPSIRDNVSMEQNGKNTARTTVGTAVIPPLQLPGGENLQKWIYDKLFEASSEFVDFVPKKIEFIRTWANRMFVGCEGATHHHKGKNHGVGVFYVNIPTNGSDLVFVRDGVYMSCISEYSSDDIVFAQTKTGELVLHDPVISHAISEHKNNEPRTCIVFEFKYIP